MVALRASRLVCSDMSAMVSVALLISDAALPSSSTFEDTCFAASTAFAFAKISSRMLLTLGPQMKQKKPRQILAGLGWSVRRCWTLFIFPRNAWYRFVRSSCAFCSTRPAAGVHGAHRLPWWRAQGNQKDSLYKPDVHIYQ